MTAKSLKDRVAALEKNAEKVAKVKATAQEPGPKVLISIRLEATSISDGQEDNQPFAIAQRSRWLYDDLGEDAEAFGYLLWEVLDGFERMSEVLSGEMPEALLFALRCTKDPPSPDETDDEYHEWDQTVRDGQSVARRLADLLAKKRLAERAT